MPGVINAGQAARANRVANPVRAAARKRQEARRAGEAPAEKASDEVDVSTLHYRDLQKLAMSRGLSAGGTTDEIRARLMGD